MQLTDVISDNRYAVLDDEERRRAARFVAPLHQRRFIAAHVMLREVLARFLQAAPDAVTFTFNLNKKPSLSGSFANQLQFNLSHSEDFAVLAIVRSGDIGIDIEHITADNKLDIAERFFSTNEIATLSAMPQTLQSAAFFQIWARKEAIIKAIGKGLEQSLSSFSVSINHEMEEVTVDQRKWLLYPLELHPDFAAAAVSSAPFSKVFIWDCSENAPILRSSNNI
jgi:4'-phosphopantetheinyl transferase